MVAGLNPSFSSGPKPSFFPWSSVFNSGVAVEGSSSPYSLAFHVWLQMSCMHTHSFDSFILCNSLAFRLGLLLSLHPLYIWTGSRVILLSTEIIILLSWLDTSNESLLLMIHTNSLVQPSTPFMMWLSQSPDKFLSLLKLCFALFLFHVLLVTPPSPFSPCCVNT